jgi:hypothetical protein
MKLIRYSTLITLVFIFSSAIFASSSDFNKFCQAAFEKRKQSQTAVFNEGQFPLHKKVIGTRRRTKVLKYYRGCRYDTPWLENTYNAICERNKSRSQESDILKEEISKIEIPQYFMFFFDGAGDFNAEYAKQILSPVNLDGSEGNDLGLGNILGLNHLVKMHAPEQPLNSMESKLELHYHSGSGFHQRENYSSAISCAKEIKDYLNIIKNFRNNLDSKWIAMGFSNGGSLAVDFQNEVTENNISIDLVLTIDPIKQALLFPINALSETIGKRNKKTKRFINVFQNSDIGSLPVINLRGKPVLYADKNYHVDTEGTILNKSGNENHFNIINTNASLIVTSCELAKLTGKERKGYCDSLENYTAP